MNDMPRPFQGSSLENFYRDKIVPGPISVAVAYCHGDVIRPVFTKSLVDAVATDRGRHIHAFITSEGLYVPRGRNEIVQQFLNTEHCEWLWFLDTDMSFPPDTLDRMLLATNNGERKIVAASYWSEFQSGQSYSTWMYLDEEGFHPYLRLPDKGIIEIASCGMGCTLIHRDVLVDVINSHDKDDPWIWFGHDLIETNTGFMRAGEDISFCTRAALSGHTTWGWCDLTVDHYKVQPIRRGEVFRIDELPKTEINNGLAEPIEAK